MLLTKYVHRKGTWEINQSIFSHCQAQAVRSSISANPGLSLRKPVQLTLDYSFEQLGPIDNLNTRHDSHVGGLDKRKPPP